MKIIGTKTTASIKDAEHLYGIVRAVSLYYGAVIEEDPDVACEMAGESALALVASKPILGKTGLGIPATIANAYVRNAKLWSKDRINWDNELQHATFENAVEEYHLFLYTVLVEGGDDLSESQKHLFDLFDSAERALIKSMLGYILNMGRTYSRAIMVENTLKAIAQVFPENIKYFSDYIDTLEEDGFEKPADYDIQSTAARNILEQNDIVTVEGDDLLPTHNGLIELSKRNPEQYKQFQEIRKYLRYQAHRAIIGFLVYDSQCQPQVWDRTYKWVTTREGIYIPRDVFPNEGWKGLVEAQRTKDSSTYGIVHKSAFGEDLNKVPVGNVEMNASYEKGSVNFVCRYVKPNTKEQTINYIYTMAGTVKKNLDRFDQMRNILTNLDKYRGTWLKDLKRLATGLDKYNAQLIKTATSKRAGAPTPPSVSVWRLGILAMLCEIGYQAAPRTGEDGTSSVEKGTGKRITTHALSTLKFIHLKTDPMTAHPVNRAVSEQALSMDEAYIRSITFAYRGKAAEPQQHTFTDTPSDGDTTSRKLLMQVMREYLHFQAIAFKLGQMDDEKDRDDLMRYALFRIPNSRSNNVQDSSAWIVVINKIINNYLKSNVKFPSTFKQFRKLKATKVFMDYMDSVKGELTAGTIESHVRQGAGLAGDALGHAASKTKAQGTMALQYYIDAMTILKYYQELDISPSKSIGNLIKDNIQDVKQ